MERNSTEEGISGATCKARSYCDIASSNSPSPNSLFPSDFASLASAKAFCFKPKQINIQVAIMVDIANNTE
jgi:hypothetical protein